MTKSRNFLIFLPFLAFLLMLICAPASFSKVLFEEDFEEGIDEDVWNPHATWEVADGVLDWTVSAFSVGYTVRDDFTDFFMFVDCKESASLAFRVQDDMEFYMVQYWEDELWWHIFSGGNVLIDANIPVETPFKETPEGGLDGWFRYKLIAEGYHFELYLAELGEELELAGTWDDETEAHESGAIGFWEGGTDHGLYDNLLVTDLEGAAVDYRDSFSTTWGNIKSRY